MVQGLVLLGVPPGHAPVVARAALGRLRAAWAASPDGPVGDLEVQLWREVVATRAADRTRWWLAAGAPAGAPSGAEEWPEGWDVLEPRLDQLTPETRLALVLSAVARLEPEQVRAVVGRDAAERPVSVAEVAAVAARIVVAPEHDVGGLPPAGGRARLAASVVGVLLVLGVVGVVVARLPGGLDPAGEDGDRAVDDGSTTAPVLVPWYAEGELHLAGEDLPIPGVVDLAQVDGGVVVADAGGRLSHVIEGGRVETIGRVAPGAPFAVSAPDRLAAWVEPGRPARLRVVDVGTGEQLVRRQVGVGERVVAVGDAGVVHAGPRRVRLTSYDGRTRVTRDRTSLVAVAGGVRAFQVGPDRLQVDRGDGRAPVAVPGVGASLSPSGRLLLTGDAALVDLRTLAEVQPALPGGGTPVSGRFGADDTVTFVVPREGSGGAPGPFDLVTCLPAGGGCLLEQRASNLAEAPLLAR